MKWLHLWRVVVVCLSLLLFSTKSFAQELEYHRFRFFIHPELTQGLTEAEVKRRLSLYVEDLNTIFAKQTIRRFTFNPDTDITLTETKPQTDSYWGDTAPRRGFEIWAHVQKSTYVGGSHGGYMGMDISGARVAAGLYWDTIYDRDIVSQAPSYTNPIIQYWIQLHNMTHEIEHTFGAGCGEYYSLRQVADTTGIAPIQSIYHSTNDVTSADPYWSQHSDYLTDPLFGWRPGLSYDKLMAQVKFANVTVAILNRKDSILPPDYPLLLPDLSKTKIVIKANDTQRTLAGARILVWKVIESPAQNILLFDGLTGSDGSIQFSWDTEVGQPDRAMLIKVYPANGGTPTVRWYSIFEAEEQKMVYGRNDLVIPIAVPYSGLQPLLTQVNTLDGAVEDTPFTISYDMLAAAADEYDDGSLPISFQIESLESGTLSNNGVAVPIRAGQLAPGDEWTWTPSLNDYGGNIPAFSIRAFNGVEFSTRKVPVKIQVSPVNDTPTFTKGSDQSVEENAGAQTIWNWASNISAGPANEANQYLEFVLTNSNSVLFASQPIVSSNGTLFFTPAENASGIATVTVKLRDDGGTANGGTDISAEQNFTLTVRRKNTAPVADAGMDQTVAASGFITPVILDGSKSVDKDGDTLTHQWYEGSTLLVTGIQPTVSLSNGVHSITLKVSDGSLVAQDSVQISVQPQTTSVAKLSGDGTLPGGIGKKIPAFTVNISNGLKGIAGTLKFDDKPNARSIKSTRITAVSVNGKLGRAFGTATINGAGSYDFYLEVNDLGKKGSKLDTFKLQLSNGLVYSGSISSGDIQVQ